MENFNATFTVAWQTVDGVTFIVTAETVIRGDDEESISFSALEVGERVKVRGVVQAGGAIVATRIELDD